ncbi:glutamine--fructose-6-phosphate transaminase (isomerizing) [Candidatus Micrarchaeota archaeon]|nr:MAG: glutamine--fructose-6-phosphate transaminase (isomerizing) [Candidatus Micrarchaeota archaeon]
MCGIIGYIGPERASGILLKGLKSLEYRGYDSAGMAVIDSGRIICKKGAGKVEEINKKVDFPSIEGNIGIAHNRWATHGKVNDVNAHPHLDCSGNIAVVHNGIIENFEELKKELKGHSFKSETDSEVIAHLIEEEMKDLPFDKAFIKAISKLKGSYAVLAIEAKSNKVMAARKGSPLVVGVSSDAFFFSSDIPSFIDWTKKVIYLHDYDVVEAGKEIKIYNLKDGFVSRPIDSVEWKAEQIKKDGFEHYMLKEIVEQSDTIRRAIQQKRELVERIAKQLKEARGVFLIGCGSSYHACLTGSYLFSKVAKMHVNPVLASEFKNYKHFLKKESMIIAISQSGETADVLEAVRAAKEKQSKIISIVNRAASSLTRESHESLLMNAGPELSVLSTKTYTSQVALMAMLAYTIAGRYDEGMAKLKKLYMDIYNLTSRNMRDRLRALAKRLLNEEHIYVLGRSLQYPTALEAALKIKEVSYIHAEAFAGGELKHGPLALIKKGSPVIVFVSKDDKDIIANANEVKTRGAYVIGVSHKNYDIFDYWIKTPESEELGPILQIIPIQILAYQLAVLKGLDPDRPRNLAKSVTVK